MPWQHDKTTLRCTCDVNIKTAMAKVAINNNNNNNNKDDTMMMKKKKTLFTGKFDFN
jgi:hypothetical protein